MAFRKFKRKSFSKNFRTKIFERDNYECQICYSNLINQPDNRVIDHKIPLSKGGSNAIGNLWLLCDSCDKRKRDSIDDELANEYIKHRLIYLQRKNGINENSGSSDIFRNTDDSKVK